MAKRNGTHSRAKKNFKDAQFPEDKLVIIGASTSVPDAIDIEIIRKVDYGGPRPEKEVTPFTLAAKDREALMQALHRVDA